jgi:sulfite reductase alpha subunit-like flavoprotein
VYDVLSEIRDRWFNIGLQLGIAPVVLKDIEKNYPESLNALREVLIICSSQKKIELKDLIEALHKPTVDQPVCARKLEDLLNQLQHDESKTFTKI